MIFPEVQIRKETVKDRSSGMVMTIITLRRTRVVGDVMIITTERREMIEITTIVDLITRLNYDNGDDNYEEG